MSKLDTKGMDEALANLRKTGQRLKEKEVEAVLQAGGAEYVKSWKQLIDQRHTRTGQMRDAVGMTEPKVTAKDGMSISIYPLGEDNRGVSNMMKAAVAHYGRHGKRGERATSNSPLTVGGTVKKGRKKLGYNFYSDSMFESTTRNRGRKGVNRGRNGLISGDFFITIAETMAKEAAHEAMQRKFDEIINREG